MRAQNLADLAKTIRYYILTSTTEAGSGHPSSSLSATDSMVALMFGGAFRYDIDNPDNPNNDRLIFSKGHASPLYYALWAAAGGIPYEELKTLRKFGSRLEGHPTMEFPFTEVATGSLGQGLSVGVGMALNAQYIDKLPYKTYVLLGDSEMAEGSNWEALQIAAHYDLHSLVGIIDINRLGQRGETQYGHDIESYERRIAAFGWDTILVDGHNMDELVGAFEKAREGTKPTMILTKTIKGKGIQFIEDQNGWHGKALSQAEMQQALNEMGHVDTELTHELQMPGDKQPAPVESGTVEELDKNYDEPFATRKAYGHALVELFPKYPNMIVLDAEVSNSTYAQTFKEAYPDRFFEMFIAEQNMVGTAVGLAARGKVPFVSTFASFFTRAADQIRVAQYSKANVNFVGSHAGVSIGEDGATQMGLEDISLFRAILGSVVLYPADHVSSEKLVEEMIHYPGIVYMRATRMDTDPIYGPDENFKIGGSKILKESDADEITLVAAGVTLYEALKAHDILMENRIKTRVIDLYSIKPLDKATLEKAATETKAIITIEDHFAEGGLGEAVSSALSKHTVPIHMLAVRKIPKSGKPHDLLDYEEISADHIIEKVNNIIHSQQ